MVVRIAKNRFLSESERQRIAIMLGLEEKREFTSAPTDFGNEIEEKVFGIIRSKYPEAVSNPYYKSEELSAKYGFDIFNHIDFEVELPDRLIWIENKATKHSVEETEREYLYQLEWHLMLLREKAAKLGKKPVLFLSHYHVEDYDTDFNSDRFSMRTFGESKCMEENYSHFTRGFEIISEEIKDFKYEKREELFADNLPSKIQEKLQVIASCLNQISEAEKQVESFKETMLGLMMNNNVKSIRNDFFKITLVGESAVMTFDKKLFERENPEIAAKYMRKSIRKSYVTLKTF